MSEIYVLYLIMYWICAELEREYYYSEYGEEYNEDPDYYDEEYDEENYIDAGKLMNGFIPTVFVYTRF